jgi:hypothetical protein
MRDAWLRTESAVVASMRAPDLATHPSLLYSLLRATSLLMCPIYDLLDMSGFESNLATHLPSDIQYISL